MAMQESSYTPARPFLLLTKKKNKRVGKSP
jgi:hypothetical protein